MIIEINEAVRVRKMDSLNWVIERRHVAGPKAKEPGKVTWKISSYHNRAEYALTSLWREGVGIEGTFTLKGAVERLSDLADRMIFEVERAMNPDRQGLRPDLKIWPDPDNASGPSRGDEVRDA